ncbi:hypothetical protein Tco_0204090 [Tanacetum coccineum]
MYPSHLDHKISQVYDNATDADNSMMMMVIITGVVEMEAAVWLGTVLDTAEVSRGAARDREWVWGSDRSVDKEYIWSSPEKPAGKVFRRWQWWPAAAGGRRNI